MDRFFWLLGPLAILLLLVVGYGSMGIAGSESGCWVDYVFWFIMVLGTLPAVVMLAWLQLRGLWQSRERHVRSSPGHRFHSAAHI